jgi:hypothetical protein
MSDDTQTPEQTAPSELEREERRLARLRLVTPIWASASERSEEPDPQPDQAA